MAVWKIAWIIERPNQRDQRGARRAGLPLCPVRPKLDHTGRLVQRLEQCPYKAKVGGSIPSPPN